jgi:VanZ family protein
LAAWPTVFALLLTIGYGMLDEMHQGRVAGRDASLLDWLADIVGAGLSVVALGMLALSRSNKRTPNHET